MSPRTIRHIDIQVHVLARQLAEPDKLVSRIIMVMKRKRVPSGERREFLQGYFKLSAAAYHEPQMKREALVAYFDSWVLMIRRKELV